jgi:putative transposase
MNGKPPKGWHHRGYLPHYDTPERAQHVVFRTFGPLPKAILECAESLERANMLDEWLDSDASNAPLATPERTQMVAEALLFFFGSRYEMHAWCVMPNHVHALLTIYDGFRLGDVVKSWKTFTGRRINATCGADGHFWALDYFDRYMRNETDFQNTIAYIESNPVAAGLADNKELWRWSSATSL